jgi:hypothetical protein
MSEAAIPQLTAIPIRHISQSVIESQDQLFDEEGAGERFFSSAFNLEWAI